MVKDSASSLRPLLQQLDEISCLFNNTIFIVYESHSTDGTQDILSDWRRFNMSDVIENKEYSSMNLWCEAMKYKTKQHQHRTPGFHDAVNHTLYSIPRREWLLPFDFAWNEEYYDMIDDHQPSLIDKHVIFDTFDDILKEDEEFQDFVAHVKQNVINSSTATRVAHYVRYRNSMLVEIQKIMNYTKLKKNIDWNYLMFVDLDVIEMDTVMTFHELYHLNRYGNIPSTKDANNAQQWLAPHLLQIREQLKANNIPFDTKEFTHEFDSSEDNSSVIVIKDKEEKSSYVQYAKKVVFDFFHKTEIKPQKIKNETKTMNKTKNKTSKKKQENHIFDKLVMINSESFAIKAKYNQGYIGWQSVDDMPLNAMCVQGLHKPLWMMDSFATVFNGGAWLYSYNPAILNVRYNPIHMINHRYLNVKSCFGGSAIYNNPAKFLMPSNDEENHCLYVVAEKPEKRKYVMNYSVINNLQKQRNDWDWYRNSSSELDTFTELLHNFFQKSLNPKHLQHGEADMHICEHIGFNYCLRYKHEYQLYISRNSSLWYQTLEKMYEDIVRWCEIPRRNENICWEMLGFWKYSNSKWYQKIGLEKICNRQEIKLKTRLEFCNSTIVNKFNKVADDVRKRRYEDRRARLKKRRKRREERRKRRREKRKKRLAHTMMDGKLPK